MRHRSTVHLRIFQRYCQLVRIRTSRTLTHLTRTLHHTSHPVRRIVNMLVHRQHPNFKFITRPRRVVNRKVTTSTRIVITHTRNRIRSHLRTLRLNNRRILQSMHCRHQGQVHTQLRHVSIKGHSTRRHKVSIRRTPSCQLMSIVNSSRHRVLYNRRPCHLSQHRRRQTRRRLRHSILIRIRRV